MILLIISISSATSSKPRASGDDPAIAGINAKTQE